MGTIGIFFIICGALLIYFGMKYKMGVKKVGEMNSRELGGEGLKGYFKIMMIIGGVAFLMIGLMWSCIGVMM